MKTQTMNSQSFDEDNYNNQRMRYHERLKHVRITFYVALVLLILGTLSFIAGIFFLFIKNPSGGITTGTGIISTISGSISTILSGLIFTFYRYENRKLDQTAQELETLANHLAGIQSMQQLINQINNQDRKDTAIISLIRYHQTGPQRVNRHIQAAPQNTGGQRGPNIFSRLFHNLF